LSTIRETIERLSAHLHASSIPNYHHETLLIISFVTGIPHLELNLHHNKMLSSKQNDEIESILQRRIKREPLQYIFGVSNFYGLSFKLSPAVLIPRPETELLVERIIQDCSFLEEKELTKPKKLLDIGTGSGCIAITLAKYLPKWKIDASDISLEALKVAKGNASLNGVSIEFHHSDLFANIPALELKGAKYDVIVSNPPYIPEGEYVALQPEITLYEPKIALVAENKGVFFYEQILMKGKEFLNDEGKVYFEIGATQSDDIIRIAEQNGYRVVDILRDYQDFVRVLVFGKI
jgi:release factor glutamine methyltransferase